MPVLRNLASPQTGLGELFVALDRAAKEIAPVAKQQADFCSDLDTFFTAWASVAPSLERTIEGGPAALHQATHSLRYEAPFVEKTRRVHAPAASEREGAAHRGTASGTPSRWAHVDIRAATALNTAASRPR